MESLRPGDLVTLADPTSRYSFLNYLKQQGRIYAFYIRENFFLLRKEYNQYCQWVTQQLDNVQFNTRVDAIRYDAQLCCYEVQTTVVENGAARPRLYYAKKLVLGTGPKPYLPACCHNLTGQVLHSSDYLPQKRQLQHCDAITLIGSGQSAAEIFYDLLGKEKVTVLNQTPSAFRSLVQADIAVENQRKLLVEQKNENDKKEVIELIKKADVIIQNFRPGVMERLGFGYEAVKAKVVPLAYPTSGLQITITIVNFADTRALSLIITHPVLR